MPILPVVWEKKDQVSVFLGVICEMWFGGSGVGSSGVAAKIKSPFLMRGYGQVKQL